MNGTRTPWEKLPGNPSEDDEATSYNEDDNNTELEQLLGYLNHTIDCLFRLSIIIQKLPPHDRVIHSGRLDQLHHQKRDEDYVRHKFKNSPEWLIKRLGCANSHRRQGIAFRKKYRD